MSELDTLIKSIVENPLDDEYRLVFADYLEEHDDPRAELIRIQLEMSAIRPRDKRRARLRKRELAIYRAHGGFRSVPAICKVRGHHGGFVNAIEITIPRFLKYQHQIFASSPITDITLKGGATRLKQVADSPYLPRLKSIKIGASEASVADIVTLISAPGLINLRKYEPTYYHQSDPAIVEAIAHKCPSQHLEDLTVPGCAEAISILSESKQIRGLKRLVARTANHSDSKGIRRNAESLCNSPVFATLEDLALSGPIDDDQLHQMFLAPLAQSLERLDLFTPLLRRGFQNVFPKLNELSIRSNVSNRLCIDIVENYKALHELSLVSGSIDDAGAEAIAEQPMLRDLQRLHLGHNNISSEGAAALGESKHRPRGQKVFLVGNPIRRAMIRHLQERFGATFGNFPRY